MIVHSRGTEHLRGMVPQDLVPGTMTNSRLRYRGLRRQLVTVWWFELPPKTPHRLHGLGRSGRI